MPPVAETLCQQNLVVVALAAVFVVVATIGSISSHKRETEEAERKLRGFKSAMDAQVSLAQQTATQAQADVEAAKVVAAKSNERAASLEVKSASIQLELAKLKAMRSMSREQQEGIASAIKKFKGTRFDMAVLPGDPEAANFLGQVSATLQLAGWEWIEWAHPDGKPTFTYTWPTLPNVGQMGGFGIEIFSSSKDSDMYEAATELSKQLIDVGLAKLPARASVKEQGIPNDDTVHVIIGRKIQ